MKPQEGTSKRNLKKEPQQEAPLVRKQTMRLKMVSVQIWKAPHNQSFITNEGEYKQVLTQMNALISHLIDCFI